METAKAMPEIMTRKQTAEYLNICMTCLDRSDAPRIKINRIVRFKKSDIDAWLTEKTKQAV